MVIFFVQFILQVIQLIFHLIQKIFFCSIDITIQTMNISIHSTRNNYKAKVPYPRNAAAQKAKVRANLKNLIKEADQILKLQMDKTSPWILYLTLHKLQPGLLQTLWADAQG